ncbi:MAG: hypothetical protein LBG58_14940, partial [Planctomycetaceae bacterium]|nr:hypothetical protein [Planctomycetaceae bacterium]
MSRAKLQQFVRFFFVSSVPAWFFSRRTLNFHSDFCTSIGSSTVSGSFFTPCVDVYETVFSGM